MRPCVPFAPVHGGEQDEFLIVWPSINLFGKLVQAELGAGRSRARVRRFIQVNAGLWFRLGWDCFGGVSVGMLRVNIQQYFLIVRELVGPVLLVKLVGPVLLGVDRVGVPGPVRRLGTQLRLRTWWKCTNEQCKTMEYGIIFL